MGNLVILWSYWGKFWDWLHKLQRQKKTLQCLIYQLHERTIILYQMNPVWTKASVLERKWGLNLRDFCSGNFIVVFTKLYLLLVILIALLLWENQKYHDRLHIGALKYIVPACTHVYQLSNLPVPHSFILHSEVLSCLPRFKLLTIWVYFYSWQSLLFPLSECGFWSIQWNVLQPLSIIIHQFVDSLFPSWLTS